MFQALSRVLQQGARASSPTREFREEEDMDVDDFEMVEKDNLDGEGHRRYKGIHRFRIPLTSGVMNVCRKVDNHSQIANKYSPYQIQWIKFEMFFSMLSFNLVDFY